MPVFSPSHLSDKINLAILIHSPSLTLRIGNAPVSLYALYGLWFGLSTFLFWKYQPIYLDWVVCFFFLSLISYSNLCMSASGCDCDVSPPTTSSSPLESNALYKLCYFKIELIYIYLYRFVSVKFKQRVFNQCILY